MTARTPGPTAARGRASRGRNGPGTDRSSPLIEVDGDTASGRWQALLLSVQLIDGAEQMLWASGTYTEEYRRVDGQWLFSRVHAAARWMTSFDEGLVEHLTLFDQL